MCFKKLLKVIFSYFLQHCKIDNGSFTKDLSFVHQDLSSIVILDNSPGAYKGFPGKKKLWLCRNQLFKKQSFKYSYFYLLGVNKGFQVN